jgi:hypothetical protein
MPGSTAATCGLHKQHYRHTCHSKAADVTSLELPGLRTARRRCALGATTAMCFARACRTRCLPRPWLCSVLRCMHAGMASHRSSGNLRPAQATCMQAGRQCAEQPYVHCKVQIVRLLTSVQCTRTAMLLVEAWLLCDATINNGFSNKLTSGYTSGLVCLLALVCSCQLHDRCCCSA